MCGPASIENLHRIQAIVDEARMPDIVAAAVGWLVLLVARSASSRELFPVAEWIGPGGEGLVSWVGVGATCAAASMIGAGRIRPAGPWKPCVALLVLFQAVLLAGIYFDAPGADPAPWTTSLPEEFRRFAWFSVCWRFPPPGQAGLIGLWLLVELPWLVLSRELSELPFALAYFGLLSALAWVARRPWWSLTAVVVAAGPALMVSASEVGR
jgi:hypothetical protein